MKIYCDGSGWNGKSAEYLVTDETGKELSAKVYNIKKTNNEMEYAGMIDAITIASDGDEIYSDSQLIVNQLTKGWKVNQEHLKQLYSIAMEFLEGRNIKIIWIPREQNIAGRLLE